jgi:uncharacterized protein
VNERAQTVAAFDRDRSRVGLRRWRVSAFGRRESQAAVRPMGVVPKPLELNWHELATTDRRAALDFYGAMFGWETIGENDAGPLGAYLVFGQRGVPYGGIFDKPPEMSRTAWCYFVRVDDVREAANKVRQNGGQVIKRPVEVAGDVWIAQCCDPSGGMFGVRQTAR